MRLKPLLLLPALVAFSSCNIQLNNCASWPDKWHDNQLGDLRVGPQFSVNDFTVRTETFNQCSKLSEVYGGDREAYLEDVYVQEDGSYFYVYRVEGVFDGRVGLIEDRDGHILRKISFGY